MDALEELEKWCRKYYEASFGCGPNIMPGDGPWVKLKGGGREVFVCEYDLPHDPDEHPNATIADVILEAIRRWHADNSVKSYKIYFSVKPEYPEYKPDSENWRWWTKDQTMIYVALQAMNEKDAIERAMSGYPEDIRKDIVCYVYETSYASQ